MTKLTPGLRLKSAVCDTEAVVVKLPAQGLPTCGGAPMLAMAEDKPGDATPAPGHDGGSTLGKRYFDGDSGLEMLCVKTGAGSLGIDGRPLALREAKQLPSSD